MGKEKVNNAAQIVWDYMHMGHELKKADCIMALGSHDTRVAERAAELYLDDYAPRIIFSGGVGRLTDAWQTTEADSFAAIAIERGVPEKAILIENKSTNTGENIHFSYKILDEANLLPKSLILVTKPYMERRAYATFMQQWPGGDVDIFVTSPQYSFEVYPTDSIPREEIIHIMVGDLQRIWVYPKLGYQIPQDVPAEVKDAFDVLVAAGYTKHLIEE